MDHLSRWQTSTKPKKKPKKPGPPLEKEIQKAIVQALLVKHRVVMYVTDAGGAGYRGAEGFRGHGTLPVGFPDLIGCDKNGRFVAVEVKRPGNRPTEAQERYLAHFRARNAIAFWADSVESALEQFETLFKEVA